MTMLNIDMDTIMTIITIIIITIIIINMIISCKRTLSCITRGLFDTHHDCSFLVGLRNKLHVCLCPTANGVPVQILYLGDWLLQLDGYPA